MDKPKSKEGTKLVNLNLRSKKLYVKVLKRPISIKTIPGFIKKQKFHCAVTNKLKHEKRRILSKNSEVKWFLLMCNTSPLRNVVT